MELIKIFIYSVISITIYALIDIFESVGNDETHYQSVPYYEAGLLVLVILAGIVGSYFKNIYYADGNTGEPPAACNGIAILTAGLIYLTLPLL